MIRILILLLLTVPALAHDAARPELNDWFNHLQSGQGLCCSLTDGERVADPDWESIGGHYRVRLDGVWIEVPDNAVIGESNRAGQTMVWPLRGPSGVTVRCFIAGMMTRLIEVIAADQLVLSVLDDDSLPHREPGEHGWFAERKPRQSRIASKSSAASP
jgi:hypothetical protein